ncbi:Ion channel [Ancylostoma ceylanicum]|uniref:Ion channel n=1 Tax=Ancylostoma ceylanicum TaxID=53326 RepID=A0A0D6MCT9_9BILA|nr:Ion channel [Ancylostoma ceylanicum]
MDSDSESSMEDELRIPVFMVLFVLLAYTAIGGFLFQSWEGLQYFEAFYFCFITMATVGFGDIVPTEQVYMFFTMAYIIFVRGAVLNSKQARELGVDYILADLQYQQKNILYEPLSPTVAKLVKESNIKILPDDITEKDGYIVQNKSYDKPALAKKGYVRVSGNIIHRIMVPSKGGPPLIIPCLIYKETDI